MAQIDNTTQAQKPKTSKLALASVLIPSTLFVGSFCFIVVLHSKNIQNLAPFFSPLVLLGWFLSPVTFILAIYALIRIRRSKGLLKGYVFPTLGILMSVLAYDRANRGVVSMKLESKIMICRTEMMGLGKALRVYSNDYYNHYPTPNEWCDLLIEHTDIEQSVFRFRPTAQEWWRDSFQYAINPNAKPNSPPDVVLLFETKGGWNNSGGPELLTFENHHRTGCNILFNDGHIQFTQPNELANLKWKHEQKQ